MHTRRIGWICVLYAALGLVVANDALAQSSHDVTKMQALNPRMPAPLKIDPDRVRAAGIRILKGAHIDIYTDVRDQPEIDELSKLFDLAIPQWCERFGVDLSRTKHFRLSAFVFTKIQEERVRQAGLIPENLPSFPAGFNRGHEMWVYVQQDIYYTRHLLLHEGTHAFMQWFLGGSGPPWYSEGMAELIGLHQWNNGQLQIGHLVRDRNESMGWGRIRIIREDIQNGSGYSLEQATNIDGAVFRLPRPIGYAWGWAACEFLSKHPATKDTFPKFARLAGTTAPEFNREFRSWLGEHRDDVERDWQLFCHEIDYGYEIGRAAIGPAEKNSTGQLIIHADRNWQQTDIKVVKGESLKIAADGRFVVAQQGGEIWPCEADGITIDYYRGKPLGVLVLAISQNDSTIESMLNPISVGKNAVLDAPISGTVCFRINDSPAKQHDNQGSLTVSINKN